MKFLFTVLSIITFLQMTTASADELSWYHSRKIVSGFAGRNGIPNQYEVSIDYQVQRVGRLGNPEASDVWINLAALSEEFSQNAAVEIKVTEIAAATDTTPEEVVNSERTIVLTAASNRRFTAKIADRIPLTPIARMVDGRLVMGAPVYDFKPLQLRYFIKIGTDSGNQPQFTTRLEDDSGALFWSLDLLKNANITP